MLPRKSYSSQMDESGRSVPKQPPPLMVKALPNLNGIKVDFAPEQAKSKMILICFFDILYSIGQTTGGQRGQKFLKNGGNWSIVIDYL
jgi:hypothetical protein